MPRASSLTIECLQELCVQLGLLLLALVSLTAWATYGTPSECPTAPA
jgi:hypothetical protein